MIPIEEMEVDECFRRCAERPNGICRNIRLALLAQWLTNYQGRRIQLGGTAVSSSRFCNVNIVMTGGQVSAISYNGPMVDCSHKANSAHMQSMPVSSLGSQALTGGFRARRNRDGKGLQRAGF
jgi:hypothetical protein